MDAQYVSIGNVPVSSSESSRKSRFFKVISVVGGAVLLSLVLVSAWNWKGNKLRYGAPMRLAQYPPWASPRETDDLKVLEEMRKLRRDHFLRELARKDLGNYFHRSIDNSIPQLDNTYNFDPRGYVAPVERQERGSPNYYGPFRYPVGH